MIICPYCGQDVVWRVRLISAPHYRFAMCFECDSVWKDNEAISEDSGTNFEQYMNEIAHPTDWTDIEKLSQIE